MKTLTKSVTLALLLGAGSAQAATTGPCLLGPTWWDSTNCYYGIGGTLDNPNPTDPNPTDPNPTDPNPTDPNPTDPNPTNPDPNPTDPTFSPPELGQNVFTNGFTTPQFFFAAAPAADFPDFVPSNNPPPPVPLPPSVWLFGTALLGLISIARRRRDQQLIVVDAPAEDSRL